MHLYADGQSGRAFGYRKNVRVAGKPRNGRLHRGSVRLIRIQNLSKENPDSPIASRGSAFGLNARRTAGIEPLVASLHAQEEPFAWVVHVRFFPGLLIDQTR